MSQFKNFICQYASTFEEDVTNAPKKLKQSKKASTGTQQITTKME